MIIRVLGWSPILPANDRIPSKARRSTSDMIQKREVPSSSSMLWIQHDVNNDEVPTPEVVYAITIKCFVQKGQKNILLSLLLFLLTLESEEGKTTNPSTKNPLRWTTIQRTT